MRSMIISVLTLCLVLVTCVTPIISAPISRDAASVFQNYTSSSQPLFIIENSEQVSERIEAPESDSQSESASTTKEQMVPKLKSPNAGNATSSDDEGEAPGTEPRPRGILSLLTKGLALYYLVMFVVGLVAWCRRPVRKVPDERYALYYGVQDGIGEAGEGYHHV